MSGGTLSVLNRIASPGWAPEQIMLINLKGAHAGLKYEAPDGAEYEVVAVRPIRGIDWDEGGYPV